VKPGDLIKWTFAPLSKTFNKENKFSYAILLEKQKSPQGSWLILLQTGERMHAAPEEIELVKECK
tara:strand:+ start:231 stop:425 length:195 start_codon:yes stop_codon:yes gene_type:complete